MFYGTGKKKRALPTGPGAAGSSALPCVSAGAWGWPVPPPLLLAHGGGCSVRDPELCPSQADLPGCDPWMEFVPRSTEGN